MIEASDQLRKAGHEFVQIVDYFLSGMHPSDKGAENRQIVHYDTLTR
jgi:hypothetical protein